MSKQPNILFIFSDQHRADCVGYANGRRAFTPNLDRLAREGMVFDNAFSPMPICCPARQALLTIRRPERFGALWNYDITLPIPSLQPSDYCWVKELKKEGYNTAYLGKWHVSPDYTPLDYGFDTYLSDSEYGEYFKQHYPNFKREFNWFGATDPIAKEHSHTHFLARKAIERIEELEKAGQPWHMRLDYLEPHPPYYVCEEFAKLYNPDDLEPWGSFCDEFENKPYIQKQNLLTWGIENFTWQDWAASLSRYLGLVSQMDDAIGMVIDYLEKKGILDDTIVIYSSDHGDMVGGHRMMDKHYVMYDDILRVPLVVRYPKLAKPGRCDALVYNNLDLPLALLELLGLPAPDVYDGESLLPLLSGKMPQNWRESVMCTYNGQQFGLYTQRCLRTKRYKYVWNTTDIDELYDLEKDPHELCNRINDPEYREVLSNLRKELYDACKQAQDKLLWGPWLDDQLLKGKKL